MRTLVSALIGRSIEEQAFAALLVTGFTIVFSIALGQMCAVVCVLLFLIGFFKKQIQWRSPAGGGIAVAFIVLAMVLSAIYGDVVGLLTRSGRLLWFILIPVTASLTEVPGRARKVIVAFLAGSAVLGIKDLFLFPILAWQKPVPDFLTALIDKGSMTDGQMLMMGVVGSGLILLLAVKERQSAPWWVWVSLVFQAAGLLINFKRGSWLCAIILIGFVVLLQLRWRAWLAMTMILVVFFALPPVQTRMEQLKREFNVKGGGRLTMWFEIAPALIRAHPDGIGFGCLTNEKMRQVSRYVEPKRNHLHANWAQVLVETGWVGLGLYLTWMVKMLMNNLAWVKRSRMAAMEEKAVAWVALLFVVGLLLNGLVEYNFGNVQLIFIYSFVSGLAMVSSLSETNAGRIS